MVIHLRVSGCREAGGLHGCGITAILNLRGSCADVYQVVEAFALLAGVDVSKFFDNRLAALNGEIVLRTELLHLMPD